MLPASAFQRWFQRGLPNWRFQSNNESLTGASSKRTAGLSNRLKLWLFRRLGQAWTSHTSTMRAIKRRTAATATLRSRSKRAHAALAPIAPPECGHTEVCFLKEVFPQHSSTFLNYPYHSLSFPIGLRFKMMTQWHSGSHPPSPSLLSIVFQGSAPAVPSWGAKLTW